MDTWYIHIHFIRLFCVVVHRCGIQRIYVLYMQHLHSVCELLFVFAIFSAGYTGTMVTFWWTLRAISST